MSSQARRSVMDKEAQESGYYSVLDVNVDASPSVIVKAYHSKALKYHPDKNFNAKSDQFQAITEAYEVLSDPEKRRLYDHYGPSLKPQLNETLAELAPLLLSFGTGFLGSSVRAYKGLLSARVLFGWEVCLIGLAGMYFCHRPSVNESVKPPIKPQLKLKREFVSVSDYVTITSMGLLVGNLSGWAATSVVLLCKAITLGS